MNEKNKGLVYSVKRVHGSWMWVREDGVADIIADGSGKMVWWMQSQLTREKAADIVEDTMYEMAKRG